MQTFCLALDLKDDPDLIREYEEYHRNVWPEIIKSIFDAGIISLQIFRAQNRLCMLIEATDEFSFEQKSRMDAGNATVQDWETLMWKYQQALPGVPVGTKWVLMEKIFSLPVTED
ncbi:MAG TPA: L-rhamnose mutarotase [Flavitalea sp.]|nr:L-rhamnose mutarotase [Flavitalea sp.]